MYCHSCGTFNDDNNFRCIQCGVVLQSTPGPAASGPAAPEGNWEQDYPEANKADTAIIFAIVAWVICGLAAIPGFIIAKDEVKGIEMGNRNPAKMGTAKAAYWLSIIALILNALVIGMLILVFGVFAASM